jgi:glycosyltransferase involved in cell wall biosynthesis
MPDEAAGGARTLIAIPALNEAAVVGDVVREVMSFLPRDADVLVIDDGSTDGTARAATSAGATVVQMPFNIGVGGAMRAAFLYATRAGYTQVVQVDADGQHDPRFIPELLGQLHLHDVVIGARFAGVGDYSARGPRWWAMRVLGAALSRICRTRLTDVTSGFRASGPRAVALFARDYPSEYLGDTVESLVLAHRAGLGVAQVPVAMRPRQAGTPSQNSVRATIYLARAILVLGLSLVRKRPELDAYLESLGARG